jgi:tetratricopeptide (TPR) repeat protein
VNDDAPASNRLEVTRAQRVIRPGAIVVDETGAVPDLDAEAIRGPRLAAVVGRQQELVALIRAELGKATEAQTLYERRLALARAETPPAPAEVAAALIDLGVHLVGQRHLDEAVAIGKANPVPVAELADAHRALSDIDNDLNQNDAALREADAALRLRIQANGAQSVEAAVAHVTLAEAHLGRPGISIAVPRGRDHLL